MKIEKPILITGAGPTGLTLANLLARMGIPFFLIDKKSHPSRESKAFGIQARSLEIFDQIGFAQKAIREGIVDNTVHLVIKGKETARLDLENFVPGETRYPHLLILPQDRTEKLMIEALKEHEEKVQWEHELTQLKEHKNGVNATIKISAGEEINRQFSYIIGCDGAGSTARNLAGFSFKGKTYTPTFYLADCELKDELHHGDVYFMIGPGYLSGLFSFPEKNRFRIFNFLNRSVTKNEDNDLSPGDVQKILDDNPYIRLKAKNVDWTSVFKIHSRITENFNKGRIFLAGDAAHVHSPAGGQGMNTGIQDAYNLAWKLNLVVKEKANPRLLHTYHEERWPIAQNLHTTTDRLFQVVTQQNRWMDLFRFYVVPSVFKTVFGLKTLRKQNLRRFSQLAIKYRNSSLNKTSIENLFRRRAPRPGDRAPWCKILLDGEAADVYRVFNPTWFTILIASSETKNEYAETFYEQVQGMSGLPPVNIFMIYKKPAGFNFFNKYGIKKNGVFIIRPDTHIGYRSSGFHAGEIEGYFSMIRY
ncbi:MAG: FAD-dependent monooxygenase [Balneolaceae bacterium]